MGTSSPVCLIFTHTKKTLLVIPPLADKADFTRTGIRNFHWQAHLAWQTHTVQFNPRHQQQVSVNVRAGITGGCFVGLYIMPHRPPGAAYAFLGAHYASCWILTKYVVHARLPRCTPVMPPVITSRLPDSTVGIVTGYGVDSWGSIPSRGKTFFSNPQHPDVWNPKRPIPGALSLESKQPGHKADHSPPSTAEVRYVGAIPPLLMSSWCGAQLIDNRQPYLLPAYTGQLIGRVGPVSWQSRSPDLCLQPASLLGLFFNPEDGGDMFLRNVSRLSTDYRHYSHLWTSKKIWCMLQQWILQRKCCSTFKMPASCTTTLLAFFCTSINPWMVRRKLVWQWNTNFFFLFIETQTPVTSSQERETTFCQLCYFLLFCFW
jgi:hypothetical protein